MNRRTHILLYDSNPNVEREHRPALEQLGYQADFVSRWPEASEKLSGGGYDFVLIDEWMVHRGFSTPINTIREMGIKTPIIIKSFMPISEFWQRCLDCESVYLMSKPLQVGELKLILEVIARNPIEPSSIF